MRARPGTPPGRGLTILAIVAEPIFHRARTEIHAETIGEAGPHGSFDVDGGDDVDVPARRSRAPLPLVMAIDARPRVEHRPETVPAVTSRVVRRPDPLEQLSTFNRRGLSPAIADKPRRTHDPIVGAGNRLHRIVRRLYLGGFDFRDGPRRGDCGSRGGRIGRHAVCSSRDRTGRLDRRINLRAKVLLPRITNREPESADSQAEAEDAGCGDRKRRGDLGGRGELRDCGTDRSGATVSRESDGARAVSAAHSGRTASVARVGSRGSSRTGRLAPGRARERLAEPSPPPVQPGLDRTIRPSENPRRLFLGIALEVAKDDRQPIVFRQPAHSSCSSGWCV